MKMKMHPNMEAVRVKWKTLKEHFEEKMFSKMVQSYRNLLSSSSTLEKNLVSIKIVSELCHRVKDGLLLWNEMCNRFVFRKLGWKKASVHANLSNSGCPDTSSKDIERFLRKSDDDSQLQKKKKKKKRKKRKKGPGVGIDCYDEHDNKGLVQVDEEIKCTDSGGTVDSDISRSSIHDCQEDTSGELVKELQFHPVGDMQNKSGIQ